MQYVLRNLLADWPPQNRSVPSATPPSRAPALGIAVGTVESQNREALGRLRALIPGLDARPLQDAKEQSRTAW